MDAFENEVHIPVDKTLAIQEALLNNAKITQIKTRAAKSNGRAFSSRLV